MNCRDRFLAAINNQLPDRVPKFAEFTPEQLKNLKQQTGYDDPAEYFCYEMGAQSTIPFGTADEVRNEVRERIATIGRGGGLVIAPSHVIPPETPWGNVIAFFDAVEMFGRYT